MSQLAGFDTSAEPCLVRQARRRYSAATRRIPCRWADEAPAQSPTSHLWTQPCAGRARAGWCWRRVSDHLWIPCRCSQGGSCSLMRYRCCVGRSEISVPGREAGSVRRRESGFWFLFGLWLTPVRVQAHHSPGVAAASKHHREVHRDHGSVRVHVVSQTRGIESQVQCDRAKLPGLTVGHIEGERGAI